MSNNRADIFVATMNDRFQPHHMLQIQKHLEVLDEGELPRLITLGYKDPIVVLIISLLVGGLGIDRLYIGDTGLGILKLITCGGFGIWALVDLFLIMGRTKEKNFELFMQNI